MSFKESCYPHISFKIVGIPHPIRPQHESMWAATIGREEYQTVYTEL